MTDAIVIGAGHNGLAAAAALAARGWSVKVLEQSDLPGGAVKTREATLPGFRHDMGAMNLSLFAGSGFNTEHGETLAKHGLEFVPVEHCFASAFPDGRWLGVSTDIDQTAERIAAFSPADAEAWRRLVKDFEQDAPHILSVLGAPMTYRSLARIAWTVWRARGAGYLRELVQFMLSSPRAFLDRHFDTPEVKATMAAWGMHIDFPPDQGGGAVFPYLEAMANQSFGMVIGKGGADTVIRSLTGMIEAAGGTVETGRKVAQITSRAGRASGVMLSDGTQLEANKAVIANVAPGALPGLIEGGTGDADYDDGLRRYRHAPGTFMLHLALDSLPDWAAGEELKRFAYVHLAPSLHMMGQSYNDAAAGLLPREPVLVVGQPTVVDPSRAPEGKHVLWVQVRMAPGRIQGDAAGEITARDWATAKAPFTDRVMALLERYAPGIGAKVLGQCAVTPPELEADNPNLVGGDQICGSHHPSQNFLFRPVPGHADWRTPMGNLYLTGAGTWPGAGVGAGSGYMLSRKLLGGRGR